MNDKIIIKNLEIYANHGVFEEEQRLGQKFTVSAVLYTDLTKAAEKDELSFSVDYGAVCHKITECMTGKSFKLIEAAAMEIIDTLLSSYPLLSGVSIEIKKPWAPIGLPLEAVSVSLERHWHEVFVALGSNMGDREKYINNAVKQLGEVKGCIVESVSQLIETTPYGNVEQDSFLNGVLKLKTYLDPHTLLDKLHDIEKLAKRERKVHWGPRTLDLDIILYDDVVISDSVLTIPHMDMHNRAFVLEPLVQLAPYARHPIFGLTASQLLDKLNGGERL